MPTPTLVATPGAVNANSYCAVAEADTYHDARLFSTDWSGALVSVKTVALIMATRVLDYTYTWASWPTSPQTQSLQWPRTGLLARNGLKFVDGATIPDEIKNATAELARQLIIADRTLDSDIETQGISSLSAGPVSLSFKDGVYAKVIPDAVFNMIPSWWGLAQGRQSGTRDLVRA